ncbi:MAG: hypothetical protein FJ161_04390 [Gammaproteobacteria bacterium]|nr:hypothetical protein [Gammaproteobacteria bacterium]
MNWRFSWYQRKYTLLMTLIIGEIWYLSLRAISQEQQQNPTGAIPPHALHIKNLVQTVIHHYLTNIQDYLGFEKDYQIEGPAGQKFGDRNFRFNYPFMFIHHINSLFTEQNPTDAILKFISDITHPESPNQISCGHGMMLRLLDVYGMCVQSTQPQPLTLEHYFASLRNLFSIQMSGDVLLRSLLMRYYDVKVVSQEEIQYVQYQTSSEDILLEDPKYHWLTNFLYEHAKAHCPHSGELQRLLRRPKNIHEILVFWEKNPLPTFPTYINEFIEADPVLKEHLDRHAPLITDLTTEKVMLSANFSPCFFELWQFSVFAGKALCYDSYEIAYALLIHYQQYYLQNDLPETLLTEHTNITKKITLMCQGIYLNEVLKDDSEIDNYIERKEQFKPMQIIHAWPKASPKLYVKGHEFLSYAPRPQEKIIAFNDLIFEVLYNNPAINIEVFFSGPIDLLSPDQWNKICNKYNNGWSLEMCSSHFLLNQIIHNLRHPDGTINQEWHDHMEKTYFMRLYDAFISHNQDTFLLCPDLRDATLNRIVEYKEYFKHLFVSRIAAEGSVHIYQQCFEFLFVFLRNILLTLEKQPDNQQNCIQQMMVIFELMIHVLKHTDVNIFFDPRLEVIFFNTFKSIISSCLKQNNADHKQRFSALILELFRDICSSNLAMIVEKFLQIHKDIDRNNYVLERDHVLLCLERKMAPKICCEMIYFVAKTINIEQYLEMVDRSIEPLVILYAEQKREIIFNHLLQKLGEFDVASELINFHADNMRKKLEARHLAFKEELYGCIRKETGKKRLHDDTDQQENIINHSTPPTSSALIFSATSPEHGSPNPEDVLRKRQKSKN